ncbi:hypothetical protein JP75_11690 [Devosia riboflavina]|uniref:Uncharacterized protein n=1 Tax=Devosia riboflavina TaxID=46914 RepID=A0A087M2A2_9HYPH|nr:hypothetical protein JP75_11690 [Devosia riboflavina]
MSPESGYRFRGKDMRNTKDLKRKERILWIATRFRTARRPKLIHLIPAPLVSCHSLGIPAMTRGADEASGGEMGHSGSPGWVRGR